VDDIAAAVVQKDRAFFQVAEHFFVNKPAGRRIGRNVNRYDVRHCKKFGKPADLSLISVRQLRCGIEIYDVRAARFGQYGKLETDISVADYAERFSAKFEAAFRFFHPFAAMRGRVLFGDLSYKDNAKANDKFGNRTRVRIRSVENRNAFFRRRAKVDLVDT